MLIVRFKSFTRQNKLWRILFFTIGFSVNLVAQTDVSSVHVLPRTDSVSPSSTRAMFRSNVDLVLVNVTVLDHSNRAITGLRLTDFSLLEDKHPQPVQYFASTDQPLSLAIVLDASASMAPRIDQMRRAVIDLVRTANPLDDISLVIVGDKPQAVFHFGDPIDTLESRLEALHPDGQTALWDAMFLSVEEMERARYQRRAMIVISDGGDNQSRYTESELKSLLAEADVEVYALGMFDRFPRRNEERNGPRNLDELTSTSGGRLLSVHDASELTRSVTQINDELRNQYILGYLPTNHTHDGHWRKLKVSLNGNNQQGKFQLCSKKGYYASSQ